MNSENALFELMFKCWCPSNQPFIYSPFMYAHRRMPGEIVHDWTAWTWYMWYWFIYFCPHNWVLQSIWQKHLLLISQTWLAVSCFLMSKLQNNIKNELPVPVLVEIEASWTPLGHRLIKMLCLINYVRNGITYYCKPLCLHICPINYLHIAKFYWKTKLLKLRYVFLLPRLISC